MHGARTARRLRRGHRHGRGNRGGGQTMIRKRSTITILATVALVLGAVVSSAATSRPAAGPVNTSRYLTMRDRVRIAIDVWLPATRSGKIPALIHATRYWR